MFARHHARSAFVGAACLALGSCVADKAADSNPADSSSADDSTSSLDSQESGGPLDTGPFDLDGDGVSPVDGDCDDANAAVNPGAEEVCDGLDNDCDGLLDDEDEDLGTWSWVDEDGDGYAGTYGPSCDEGATESSDCDDENASIYPGADELPCDGADSNCDGLLAENVAQIRDEPYDTIQAAIDAASDGDTVWVCGGTHYEQLRIEDGVRLTLAGWTGDAEDVMVDGTASYTILYIGEGAEVTVADLAFQNGEASDWGWGAPTGGAMAALRASVDIDGCVFRDNHSNYAAGAIVVMNDPDGTGGHSGLTVTDSLFENNSSYYASGALGVNGYFGTSDVLIQGTVFENNIARYRGGAISVDTGGNAYITIEDSLLTANEGTESDGGAIGLSGNFGVFTLDIVDSVFDANVAKYNGAAIYVNVTVGFVDIILTDSAILSSSTSESYPAGVQMVTQSTLTSNNVDWGTDSTENVPYDLHTGPGGALYDNLGAAETFTCIGSEECTW